MDNEAFFRVEHYIWKSMYEQPPDTELRQWYVDGWWTLVNSRPEAGQ